MEQNKFPEAIRKFTYAIKLNPEYKDVYFQRATAYEKNGDYLLAAGDYLICAEKYRNKAFFYYQTGKMYYQAGEFYRAIEFLHYCTDLDKKNLDAHLMKIKSMLILKNYDAALYECNQALKIKRSAQTLYFHGLTSYYLKDYETAEDDLLKAIRLEINYHEAFSALAELYYDLGKNDKALDMANRAVIIMPAKADYYLLRSKIKIRKNDLNGAISDLTEILTHIDPDNPDILLLRAKYYESAGQYLLANQDYSAITDLYPEIIIAFYYRAKNNEILGNINMAVTDYQLFLLRCSDDYTTIYHQEVALAKERIYQLNKENEVPEIRIIWPLALNQNLVEIANNKDTIHLSVELFDKSELNYFRINNETIKLNTNYGLRKIQKIISIPKSDIIELEAEDIYFNYSKLILKIIRTETSPPHIHLISPYASDNGEIYLESGASSLFFEGKITDESLISDIYIDDISASYRKNELNPVFRAFVPIANKDGVTVRVIDKYGNRTEKYYFFNRDGIRLLGDNPMGKTWVIFIENTNYEFLPPLEGPKQDAEKIKQAFSSYQISNFILKKNMTKADMQKFFMIELRDMIKENNVNSLLIWFAGHGKFVNEMGYWLPVNAINNDEFTFYPVHSLKSALQLYGSSLKHILVVTDACEAGPSFSMVIRADTQNPDCSDWTYASLRSAQVLTSTSQGWASDQSVFAQAFAEALSSNPNTCISIDQIAVIVSAALKNKLKQVPVFGKIAGLEDEDGTFFFLKKEK